MAKLTPEQVRMLAQANKELDRFLKENGHSDFSRGGSVFYELTRRAMLTPYSIMDHCAGQGKKDAYAALPLDNGHKVALEIKCNRASQFEKILNGKDTDILLWGFDNKGFKPQYEDGTPIEMDGGDYEEYVATYAQVKAVFNHPTKWLHDNGFEIVPQATPGILKAIRKAGWATFDPANPAKVFHLEGNRITD